MSREEIEAVLAQKAALDVLLFDAEGKRLYLRSKGRPWGSVKLG